MAEDKCSFMVTQSLLESVVYNTQKRHEIIVPLKDAIEILIDERILIPTTEPSVYKYNLQTFYVMVREPFTQSNSPQIRCAFPYMYLYVPQIMACFSAIFIAVVLMKVVRHKNADQAFVQGSVSRIRALLTERRRLYNRGVGHSPFLEERQLEMLVYTEENDRHRANWPLVLERLKLENSIQCTEAGWICADGD